MKDEIHEGREGRNSNEGRMDVHMKEVREGRKEGKKEVREEGRKFIKEGRKFMKGRKSDFMKEERKEK